MIDVISTYSPAVDDLCSIIAEIDVIVSLAHVSCDAGTPYVRPTLTEAGDPLALGPQILNPKPPQSLNARPSTSHQPAINPGSNTMNIKKISTPNTKRSTLKVGYIVLMAAY